MPATQTPGASTTPLVDVPGHNVPVLVGDDAAAAGKRGPAAAALVITVYGKPITQGSKTRNRFGGDRKSTRLNSSHTIQSRMPSSA